MIHRALAALTVLVLGCVAHAADDDAGGRGGSGFAAYKGEDAEERLRERLRARVRTIPGTETQFLVGGYLQLDAIASRRLQEGDEQDTFLVSTTPFGPADRAARLGVRQSQINWLSRTPTQAGPVWTRLEANLFPLDGTTALTLNQLFVRWGEHLVVGKTYSSFMDDAALPTTLDYNGPSAVTFVRQWLARASIGLGAGWTLEGSVEEPQVDLHAGGALLEVGTRAERPDLAARVRYEGEHGHVQVAGLSRRIRASVTSPLGTTGQRIDGTGVSVSGSVPMSDNDTVMFQGVTGRGVGRYFNDPLSATGLTLDSGGRLALLRMSGITLYYQHDWAADWTSVAGASRLRVDADGTRAADSLRQVVYASANLFHRVTPTFIVGAEALWGEATRADGSAATNLRLQVSARYLVF